MLTTHLSHKYVMHIHREMGQEKANVMARHAQTLGFVFFGFGFFFFQILAWFLNQVSFWTQGVQDWQSLPSLRPQAPLQQSAKKNNKLAPNAGIKQKEDS